MKLVDVLKNSPYELIQGGNPEIESLTIDSRRVERGAMFFCIKGLRSDGHLFVPDVIERQAAAIVAQDDILAPEGIAVVKVKDTREALAYAAANFYGNPADEMTLIGVTGTNGKTSTTYFMESVLNAHRKKTGLIGTVEFRVGGEKLPVYVETSTTPDAIELQQILRRMLDAEADNVVMEVSSHALALKKTDGLKYKVGIFTNLTRDHLDFHKTMGDYRDAKAKLFSQCEYSVLNADDENTEYMSRFAAGKVLTFGINSECDLKAEGVQLSETGCSFSININDRHEDFFVPVRGRFSVYNSLGVIGAALCLDIPVKDIRSGLAALGGVPGRIQSVKNELGFDVVIDYAHTPDGLQNIISAVRETTPGKVITVFGCGGDRDKEKRPVMGRIAGELSDYCIITSDNPRNELPETIIGEVETGTAETKCEYEKQPDRRLAITRAVALATTCDSVIIAGKGHEDYQVFADGTIHFDDREEAEEALRKRRLAVFTLKEAVAVTGASYEYGPYTGEDKILFDISIDSRKISRGSLFIAVKGENFDGHDFIGQAFAAGAAACMVERDVTAGAASGGAVLKVPSTAQALLDLAEAHRRKFNIPIIALTGSSGKTTTKDMIASVLSQKYNTLWTEKNFNNEIGLPLTIFRLTHEHECAVFELGMNHFFEISRMSKAARPDICLITNIGMAHAGNLGNRGRLDVLRAKTEILDYVNPDGLAIFNGDDDLLAGVAPPCERIYYGFGENCEIRGLNLCANCAGGSQIDVIYAGQSYPVAVPCEGVHMASNALAAVAVGMKLGLSLSQIQRGIAEFTPSGNRMDVFESPWGVTVINDSYNANPGSMTAALDVLAARPGRRVCILGDMLELGEFTEAEHRKLGSYAAGKKIDIMIFVGELSLGAYNAAREIAAEGVFHYSGKDALAPDLRGILEPGSTVLIKGSRSMKLDMIADMLREEQKLDADLTDYRGSTQI